MNWFDQVIQEVGAFADLGSLQIKQENQLAWSVDSRQRVAQFSMGPDSQISVHLEGTIQSYSSFLAGPNMANLRQVALNIEHLSQASFYVDTKARKTPDSDDNRPIVSEDAIFLLTDMIRDFAPEHGTRVIFISADAGSGKTFVLNRLAWSRAREYQHGLHTSIYLYVNAQGRALADLQEAIAVALDDVRARFSYAAVAALTRAGVVVPIIDGFDELIGPVGGYDEGFSSLATFLEELGGQGQMIAAARSSYYYQEFVGKKMSRDQVWYTEQVYVEPWNTESRRSFIHHVSEANQLPPERAAHLHQHLEAMFASADLIDLAGKPFFVARATDLLLHGATVMNEKPLLDALVDEFLKREVEEKLVRKDGGALVQPSDLRELLIQIADEMWLEETRELDFRVVRDLIAVVISESLASSLARERLAQRGSMLAFLTSAERTSRVEFEHELIYSYFLALALERRLRESSSSALQRVLARATLPARVGELISLRKDATWLQTLVSTLHGIHDPADPRAERVSQNAGQLVAAACRELHSSTGAVADIQISSVVFSGVSFDDVLFNHVQFSNVTFYRVSLRATTFRECRAEETTFIEPLLDGGFLGIQNLEAGAFHGIRLPMQPLSVFHPPSVVQALSDLGLPSAAGRVVADHQDPMEPALDPLRKLMRGYIGKTLVWPEDNQYRRLSGQPDWDRVTTELFKAGIIQKEERESKGVSRPAWRIRFKPDQVLGGVDPNADVPDQIRTFWGRIRTLYSAKD